ncbi:MAG: RHS repeat-associated core domain-containing protein, partial [Xanthomonadales bacterium PRO7]|nr:RHS repeat-associated core domain-containing protein [Xanthomonadales bacterium PRO7]
WKWDYFANNSAFGENAPTGTLTFNLRFMGQYYDSETGLIHNGFRDYDKDSGQYIESDPVGLQGGISTYAYVEGNPTNDNDPYGLLRRGYGFSNNNWKKVEKAEDRIRKELERDNGCCMSSKLHNFKKRLDAVLATGTFNFVGTIHSLHPTSTTCGDTIAPWVHSSRVDNAAFNNPICHCLADVIYHELLHQMGIPHKDPRNPEDPNDEPNRMERACRFHLCGPVN